MACMGKELHPHILADAIVLIHKFQNASLPYPTMQHSEQKCAHFCSECCIMGYELRDLWDWSIVLNAGVAKCYGVPPFLPCDSRQMFARQPPGLWSILPWRPLLGQQSGTAPFSLVKTTHLTVGYPWVPFTGTRSSDELQIATHLKIGYP